MPSSAYPAPPSFSDAQLKARPLDQSVRNTLIAWLAEVDRLHFAGTDKEGGDYAARWQALSDDTLVTYFKDQAKRWSSNDLPAPGVIPSLPGHIPWDGGFDPGGVVGGITGGVGDLAGALKALTDPNNWKRAAEFAIGLLLIGLAASAAVKGSS